MKKLPEYKITFYDKEELDYEIKKREREDSLEKERPIKGIRLNRFERHVLWYIKWHERKAGYVQAENLYINLVHKHPGANAEERLVRVYHLVDAEEVGVGVWRLSVSQRGHDWLEFYIRDSLPIYVALVSLLVSVVSFALSFVATLF